MNDTVMLIVGTAFMLFAFCVGVSLWLAWNKDNQLAERFPGMNSYTWGYFLGYSGIITALMAVAAAGTMIAAGMYRAWLPAAVAYAVATGIASYGVLTRRRWGWVLHIPLSLNMGLWAFNSVYASNRWREFPWR